MAVVGVGIDVVDIERFVASLERTPGLRERLFTPGRGRPAAGLPGGAVRGQGGVGQGARRARPASPGTTPRSSRSPPGGPLLTIRGTVRARADELGVASVHLSLSHDAGIASAVVVLES